MGVNKNISIFMLFDCVRVNTGLGFQFFYLLRFTLTCVYSICVFIISGQDKWSVRAMDI
jgi:hypothetical protein